MAKANFGNYFKQNKQAYTYTDDDWGDFGPSNWLEKPDTTVNVNVDGKQQVQQDVDTHLERVKNESGTPSEEQIANIQAAQSGNFLTRSWDKIKGNAQDWKDITDKNMADYKEQQSRIPPPRPNVPVEEEDEFFDEDITIDEVEKPNTKVKGFKGFMQRLLPGGKSGMKYVDPDNTFENWEEPVNNPLTNPQSDADVKSNLPTNVPDAGATVATAWNNIKNGTDTSAGSATDWANNQSTQEPSAFELSMNPNQETLLPDNEQPGYYDGSSYATEDEQNRINQENAQREHDQTAVSTDPRQMIKSKTPGLKGFAQRLLPGGKEGYDYTQESLVDPNRKLAEELSQGKITEEEYKKLRQQQVEEDPSQQKNYQQEYSDDFGVTEENGVSEEIDTGHPFPIPDDQMKKIQDAANSGVSYETQEFNPQTDANEPYMSEENEERPSEDPYGDWLDMNPEQKEKQSRETALDYKDDILGDNNPQGWNIKDLVGERASDMEDIEQQKRENLDDGTTQPPSTPVTDAYNRSSNAVKRLQGLSGTKPFTTSPEEYKKQKKAEQTSSTDTSTKQLQGLEGLGQQLQDSSYDFNAVPDSVVQAITQVETGGASQDSLDAAFKREGAVGSMQQRQIFQDEIARLDPSMKGYDPNDPEQAQKAAKIYIAHQMKSGSDLDTAIRAYNAGRGGANKGLGGDYLKKFKEAYEQQNQSQDNSIFLGAKNNAGLQGIIHRNANPPFNSPVLDAWSDTMFKEKK